MKNKEYKMSGEGLKQVELSGPGHTGFESEHNLENVELKILSKDGKVLLHLEDVEGGVLTFKQKDVTPGIFFLGQSETVCAIASMEARLLKHGLKVAGYLDQVEDVKAKFELPRF